MTIATTFHAKKNKRKIFKNKNTSETENFHLLKIRPQNKGKTNQTKHYTKMKRNKWKTVLLLFKRIENFSKLPLQ